MNLIYEFQIRILILYERLIYKYCACGEIMLDNECDYCSNSSFGTRKDN